MVPKATGLAASRLGHLVATETHRAQLGFLGSDYIDVLQLNTALAALR
jgi:K+-transporting ATPase c subunit